MKTLIQADKTATLNPRGLTLMELLRRLASPVVVEDETEKECPAEKQQNAAEPVIRK